VLLDDLASKNGTYLNGARLSEQQLLHVGDRIQVGYTVLEAQ
jgi:pSer/pThr/pTyr-binding forkhead associated (FHA) protein